jgi:hypothetical protein
MVNKMIGSVRSKHEKLDESPGLLSGNNYLSTSEANRLRNINIKKLNGIIKDLTQLKNDKKLSDKEFSALLTYTCAAFVENEFVITFRKVFGNTMKHLFGD